ALKWSQGLNMPGTGTSIVAGSVNINFIGPERKCGDHDVQCLTGKYTLLGTISFYIRGTVQAAIRPHPCQLPIGCSGSFIFKHYWILLFGEVVCKCMERA